MVYLPYARLTGIHFRGFEAHPDYKIKWIIWQHVKANRKNNIVGTSRNTGKARSDIIGFAGGLDPTNFSDQDD